ncbi:hypothetical protein KKF81_04885 [Candidatus Micrarchaeota archaeon]|nr:hypothetical protein [Candidatus Micrarchaeota archaeon]MBU1166262.1 hypothetical protein [Candidatus Micrarchaeota archaeon]MBU1886716.1 hypothetical protein [Candidatus Micrarchaeota archaeon]
MDTPEKQETKPVLKETKVQPPETKKISDVLQTAQISLDKYDDIFSDFDPSPYASRLLSYDFIKELYRRYSENKKGEYEVTFTVPKQIRSQKIEELIKKRIKEFFKEKIKKIDRKAQHLRNGGIIRLCFGLIISVLIFIVPFLELPFFTILSVLVWYLLWSGYELMFDGPEKIKSKRQFYHKFVMAKYHFMDEEEVVQNITSNSYR